jgi:general secretion pathway protein L
MKEPESSISLAWFKRAPRAAAPRAGRGRLDLMLPRNWPESLEAIHWRWQHAGKTEAGSVHELDQLPADARRASVMVWTAAAETMLTTVRIPTRSPRKIAQALPYALEDRLLGDPDSLHFAWRNETDGSLSVAVTARARLQTWMDRLSRAGLRPASICPAMLLVPWAEDYWSLVFFGNELLVRSGAMAGFVCPAEGATPPALLVTAIQEAARQPGAPEAVVVFHAPKGFSPEAWSKILGLPVRLEAGTVWDKLREPVAPINLLQGQYEPESALGESLRPYRPAAVLLGLWLVSSLAFDVSDWWQLKREHETTRKEMTSILTANFPETKTVLDPAAQMQRAVDQLLARSGRDDRELLPMLGKASAAMRSAPNIRLRGLRYADHSLTLELTWPAPTSPDAFKTAVESAGLRAEVLSLSPRAGEVDGRIRLTAAGKPAGRGT